jgi:hypothetical protein
MKVRLGRRASHLCDDSGLRLPIGHCRLTRSPQLCRAQGLVQSRPRSSSGVNPESSLKQVPRVPQAGQLTEPTFFLQENQAALLRIQDPGGVLRHMKAAAAAKHDRDALMEVSTCALPASLQSGARSSALSQLKTNKTSATYRRRSTMLDRCR